MCVRVCLCLCVYVCVCHSLYDVESSRSRLLFISLASWGSKPKCYNPSPAASKRVNPSSVVMKESQVTMREQEELRKRSTRNSFNFYFLFFFFLDFFSPFLSLLWFFFFIFLKHIGKGNCLGSLSSLRHKFPWKSRKREKRRRMMIDDEEQMVTTSYRPADWSAEKGGQHLETWTGWNSF